jgi:hypothetical protein
VSVYCEFLSINQSINQTWSIIGSFHLNLEGRMYGNLIGGTNIFGLVSHGPHM